MLVAAGPTGLHRSESRTVNLTDDLRRLRESADQVENERDNEMTTTEDSVEHPIFPSGIARFADGIVEVTTGDGVRVATADIVRIGVEPPRAGRLSLSLVYRAGLDTVKTSFWVEPVHAAALRRLVDAVMETKRDA
jgi:hypothetical protein